MKVEVKRKSSTSLLTLQESAMCFSDYIRSICQPEDQIIIAGGAGIKCCQDFELLAELAHILNGQLCISRPVADKGWYPENMVVGLSGIKVSPRLYIAIGISGTFYHTVGMNRSKYVISINVDPDAPLYNKSDLGILCDYKIILPYIMKYIPA